MAFNLSSFTAGAGTDVSNCTVIPSGFSTELSLSSITSGIALGNIIYTMASAADSTTIPNLCGNFIVTYPTTTTSLSLTMPAAPFNFQVVKIKFGVAIPSLTLIANTGQSFLIPTPTATSLGVTIKMQFISATNTWYPE